MPREAKQLIEEVQRGADPEELVQEISLGAILKSLVTDLADKFGIRDKGDMEDRMRQFSNELETGGNVRAARDIEDLQRKVNRGEADPEDAFQKAIALKQLVKDKGRDYGLDWLSKHKDRFKGLLKKAASALTK